MRTLPFTLILGVSFSSLSQEKNDGKLNSPGCGPASEKFDVVTTKNGPSPAPTEVGKALLYVIQDDTHFESRPGPTTRVGVDGQWVGATRSNSYLRAALDPGDHLCAS